MIADRAAEVSAVGPGGTGTSGSGFLVGPRLVLTARHVVGDAASSGGSESVVRPMKDNTKYRCRTVWASASRDLALLEITDGDWAQPPVRLGCLTTSTPHIPCEAVGFPRAQLHDDGWVDSEHITGSLNPATAVVSDRHQLVVTSGSAPTVGRGCRARASSAVTWSSGSSWRTGSRSAGRGWWWSPSPPPATRTSSAPGGTPPAVVRPSWSPWSSPPSSVTRAATSPCPRPALCCVRPPRWCASAGATVNWSSCARGAPATASVYNSSPHAVARARPGSPANSPRS
ncbi:S1 family peptidase [Streptomyces cyslabdanicus]|uniref:S1 family peptidase n=1 Tax=Streptomyces cyslabdanicus TaxID=1470456 RepID=UPI004044B835